MVGVGSFVLLMLAMYPEIQDKVRQEIESIVGNEIVTYDMCTDMKYMDMVIRETMRLFPAGPFLPRKITGDIKLGILFISIFCNLNNFYFIFNFILFSYLYITKRMFSFCTALCNTQRSRLLA